MRIIVADHHAGPRRTLKAMLEEEAGLDLVGEAVDAQGLLALVDTLAPDLVLVDDGLPGSYMEDLVAGLQKFKPRPIVIVMSDKLECSRQALRAGADAFVSKTASSNWLLQSLQKYIKFNP